MRLLESFLDATGLSGQPWQLQEASRTLRDDRGRLKHYACNGLEASSQAYEGQETLTATARAEPTEHTNSTRLLFLQAYKDCRTVAVSYTHLTLPTILLV